MIAVAAGQVGSWPGAGEMALRLALAVVLGGLVGLEREIRGRSAGLRTNLLVCLGSTMVMLTAAAFPNPGRLAQGALTGICLLYTSPSPRDLSTSRMPSSA